ncbi:DUF418 domain-containing protein [Pseudoalteromonas sp. MMG013]|uniref:DUF418 domain-containing protein n=1 Tax=Pseudoalteromonas sp. MMG013 TaxID=2822687 RepID=UPI001B381A58|nr:DUF418 domain-containing protein [Pseudoalteromonas sp. MMG013]MBQ4864202.1 DUF418 domain-containing protein [Pseudoalteromonas sp. MMG013]
MTLQQVPRLPLLDIFRGFAIFGIFFVNITIMHCLFINQDAFSVQFQDPLSDTLNRLLQLFFYNKFFPIFSFLFGFGIASQMQKKRQLKQPYIAFFTRRMSILFMFGLAHISFLWSGDVVHLYAILGLLCLVFIHASCKVLVCISGVLLLFPFYDQLTHVVLQALPVQLDKQLLAYTEQGIIDTLRHGNYLQIITLHWHEYVANLPMLLFYLGPIALSMFLLGIAAGKARLTFASKEWTLHYKNMAIFIAIIGLIYKVIFLWLLPETQLYRNELLRPLWFKMMFLSDVTLGICYLWGIAWLWHKHIAQKFLMPFSYVGRTALSNYLLQSFIGLLLFTSLGASLYQTLSPMLCFIIASVVFMVQIGISAIWLHYFQYGPCEWLWRCGSYLEWVPFRKVKENVTQIHS